MTLWIRLDALWAQHPRMIKAGYWGKQVARTLWCLAKTRNNAVIPKIMADGEYLAKIDGADVDVPNATNLYNEGIERAIQSGLFDRNENGDLIVRDWKQYQIDINATARQRKHRKRDVTDVTVTTVTNECHACHGDRTGQDNTGQDKNKKTPCDFIAGDDKKKGKKTKRKPVDIKSDTPPEGLSPSEAIRRSYAIRWKLLYGEEPPSFPRRDNTMADTVLRHHKRLKTVHIWQDWVGALLDAFFSRNDGLYQGHRFPAIITLLGDLSIAANNILDEKSRL